MNYKKQYKLQLIARSEGKIKSYESCSDVRAWSHDVEAQDQYLREWMKCDMPFSVLPISLLVRFLRIMTCRSRRRVTPKCHPDCKSKILLESICNSCHAVRDCLEQDDNFDKYFVEEELETSHWPCDRCLEALKSIKMFWKIIIDKVFRINISKLQEENGSTSCDTVKTIATAWQQDMVQQAVFVKNIAPVLGRTKNTRSNLSLENSSQKTIRSCPPTRSLKRDRTSLTKHDRTSPNKEGNCSTRIPVKSTLTVDRKITRTQLCNKAFHKSTSTTIQVVDVGCDTCSIEKENEELDAYKKNLEVLQDKFNLQHQEKDRLQEENTSLKIELKNVYKSGNWKAAFYNRSKCVGNYNILSDLPKPFESNTDNKFTNSAENIDSEMLITMKNCRNDFFKHVSLLQVLHKSNSPIKEDLNSSGRSVEKDPLKILTKVQNTFGAMVKREISIINEKMQGEKKNEVEATFLRTRPCRSDPSCSTVSSRISSECVLSNADTKMS